MADTKISALAATTSIDDTDEIPFNDAGTTKKMTIAQLRTKLGYFVKSLSSLFTNTVASVTMTNVSGLDMALTAGHYFFTYALIWRTNDATCGIRLNANYTGSHSKMVSWWRWVDVSATAATAAADQDAIAATGQVMGAMASRVAKTTAAGGAIISADQVSADMMLILEGILVATGAGDLELWSGNEVAAAGDTTTIEIGSGVVVNKMG